MKRSPRDLAAMVEYQVRKWRVDLERRPHEEKRRYFPVITISREFGAQGARIGELVAEQLGYTFWDQELVHEIASATGAPDNLFDSIDEHSRNAVMEMITAWTRPDAGVSESRYVPELLRVVHSIGVHGRAVVIGRGAQFILSKEQAFRVRIVCPLEERAKGLAFRKGLSQKEALALAREVDADRHTFIRQTYQQEIANPTAYNVMLNVAGLEVERAAEMVRALYETWHETERAAAAPTQP